MTKEQMHTQILSIKKELDNTPYDEAIVKCNVIDGGPSFSKVLYRCLYFYIDRLDNGLANVSLSCVSGYNENFKRYVTFDFRG